MELSYDTWTVFFSQSGKEICDLAERLGRWPDKIITNKRPDHLRTIDKRLLERKIIYLPNTPSVEEYFEILSESNVNSLITLHGWLRVIPEEVCNKYNIFNGHPGLITSESEGGYGDLLKGKDPQQKAVDLRLPYSGCVVHKVTAGVDQGLILLSDQVRIEGLEVEKVFTILREASLDLWISFIKNQLKSD